MEFYVNPYDGVPVYLQIIQLVRNGVALGTLHPGDRTFPPRSDFTAVLSQLLTTEHIVLS